MTINALSIIPVKTASCSVMGDYAIKKKQTVKWANKKVGDIVLYDFNHNGTSDHTGIIEKINSNGTIDVIEGNTSESSNDNGGNVMRRTRSKSQVNYLVRPKYDEKVTAKMVIATAVSQLGTKESPKGSNKVKYNTWFYGRAVQGSAYPWCMTFVEWCFAHVLQAVAKPKTKYTGAIPSPTLKLGSKGKNVKLLQAFLNWYHSAWKLAEDGEWGTKTEDAFVTFQFTEGLTPDGVYGKLSQAKANAYKSVATTPTTPTKPTTPTTTPSVPTTTPTTTPTTKPTTTTTSQTVKKPTGKYTGILIEHEIKKGYKKPSVGFLQRFLNWYGKFGLAIDNECGEKTEAAIAAFQKAEGLTVDNVFGKKSFAKAKAYLNTKHSYRIVVDLINQICTVYDNNVPVISEFISSARKGKTTPTGKFKIQGASGGRKAKYRTCLMSSKTTYAEFACRFKGAKMLHAVPYKKRNTDGLVNKTEFNKLGSVASAGCVRQPIVLAKFIYENCPIGTPVEVLKGTKGKYPMGKPIKYKATSNVDPTYEG